MSYLIRCDVCGKEMSDRDSWIYRFDICFERTDQEVETLHTCRDCYKELKRFMGVLEKVKEEK